MRLLSVGILGVLAATVAACSKDTDGTPLATPPLAGLRYVNVSPDAPALTFRVVDIVGDAPNTVAASYRTGGSPYGVGTAFLPLHFPVRAGTRTIRVFRHSTNVDTAQMVVWEGTFDFVQGSNYTMYLYGSVAAPTVNFQIDNPPALTGTQVGMRVINLIPASAGAPSPAGNVDAYFAATATVPPFSSPVATNLAYGGLGSYSTAANAAANMSVFVTDAGNAAAAVYSAAAPAGTAANPNNPPSTQDPIPGTNVAGTVLTAVLVPQSAAGAPTTFATPTVLFLVDKLPPRITP
jgi:hypothetical protein